MDNSIWEAFKEGHEKYNQQRQAKQKADGWPCVELYTKQAPDWIIDAKCDSCEEYKLDISKWKTTDDVKALMGQKCPKCGKDMITEKTFIVIYDTAKSIHKISGMWNLFAPKKLEKLAVHVVNGEPESLKLGENEIKL